MNRSTFAALPAILFTLFILGVIISSDRGTCEICVYAKSIPYGDKAGHFVLYGMLVAIVGIARQWSIHSWKGMRLLSSSAWLAILIALEEVSQLFFSSRTGDAWDLAASWIGVILGDYVARKIASP